MKLKSLLFILCLSAFTCLFAENASYLHATNPDPVHPSIKTSNGCDIIIQNNTDYPGYPGHNVYVSSSVDNYYAKFVIYPHHDLYLSMYYDGYCHLGVRNIRIETFRSYTDTGWVDTGSVLGVNYLKSSLKTTVTKK